MKNDEKQVARVLSAFSNANRIRVLRYLVGGEKCVSDIGMELGLGQSNLSKHLKALKASGLVVGRREGQNIYYSISEKRALDVIEIADRMVRDQMKAAR